MHFRPLLAVFLLLLPLPGVSADESFDYQLRDMDGRLYKVSDYRGKWLIINFWATWCAPCLKEMPELERFYQQNKALAQVWGVSFEDSDKAAIRAYVERLGITLPGPIDGLRRGERVADHLHHQSGWPLPASLRGPDYGR